MPVKEAIGTYINGIPNKTACRINQLLVKAFLAGVMIAFGAAGSSVAAHSLTNVGMIRLVSGVVFPVGLMMVIFTGAELFTGDCLIAMGVAARKTKVSEMLRVLVLVYLGNMAGSVLLAGGVYLAGQFDYSGGLLGAYTIKLAVGKCNLGFFEAFVSGILCNILVCLAVVLALCAKEAAGKLLSAFFVIMLFVICGFEHCVANMYYIPAGLFAKMNASYVEMAMTEYGFTNLQIDSLNVANFLVKNQLPVTLGNVVGGMIFVGFLLWYSNKE